MKPRTWIVLTADQRRSRSDQDRVPDALARLVDIPSELGFERTAGDEIQGLLADPGAAVAAVRELSRTRGWRVGLGVGAVDCPLPGSTREARGEAYVNARSAIENARRSPVGLSVVGLDTADAEAALWLLRALWLRRTPPGWELADLLGEDITQTQAAHRLGISASAVSQRTSVAALEESARGEALVAALLARAVGAED